MGAVNLLDPQAVVLGGSLSRLAPWLPPSLDRELTLHTPSHERVLDDPAAYAHG
ncbi:hypothetical protein ACIQV3_01410 [Streptomyces sp. NPDC099050]|uniref:hypothetical protein n=1 Tax=Streptomyces sp. NPDC099050 TaxID=3366100 RepID=UPI003807CB59